MLAGRILIAVTTHVAGRTTCRRGPHAARRPHFAHPCSKLKPSKYSFTQTNYSSLYSMVGYFEQHYVIIDFKT